MENIFCVSIRLQKHEWQFGRNFMSFHAISSSPNFRFASVSIIYGNTGGNVFYFFYKVTRKKLKRGNQRSLFMSSKCKFSRLLFMMAYAMVYAMAYDGVIFSVCSIQFQTHGFQTVTGALQPITGCSHCSFIKRFIIPIYRRFASCFHYLQPKNSISILLNILHNYVAYMQ